MHIRFWHQKSVQTIWCTRLLDYDPGWGHEIGTNDFLGPFTALGNSDQIYEIQIYDELVPETSNNVPIIFESHHDQKKSRVSS